MEHGFVFFWILGLPRPGGPYSSLTSTGLDKMRISAPFQQELNDLDLVVLDGRMQGQGALYGVRRGPEDYSTQEINGRWDASKPIIVAPRAFANSPFPGEANVIYFGGHDANFNKSTDMVWIFKACARTVLGYDSVR